MPDVQMPDGTIMQGVPEGASKDEIMSRFNNYKSSLSAQPSDNNISIQSSPDLGLTGGLAASLAKMGTGIQQRIAEVSPDIGQLYAKGLSAIRPDLAPELSQITSEDVRQSAGNVGAKLNALTNNDNQGVLSKAGQFTGNVAPYLFAPGGAIVGSGLAGAASGYLEPNQAPTAGEGESQALGNAAEGGLVGAATGGLVKGVIEAPGVISKLFTGKTADNILASRLAGQDLRQLQANLAQSGANTILPDIAGDEIKGLTRAVGAMPGGTKQLVSDALNNRSEGAVERVSQQLSKNISNVDTYFTNLDDMANARATVAAPMYQKAFAANKSVTSPAIDRVLDTPAGQSALKTAVTKMQNDMSLVGSNDPELMQQAKLAGTYQPGDKGIAAGLNLRTLDYTKRALDDQIGAAQRAGEKDNVRILTGLKNNLVTALDKADVTGKAGPNSLKPEGGLYFQARNVFSDSYSMENAQKEGIQIFNNDPEQIRAYLKNASPAEAEAYRIGVRKNLQDIANKTSDGSDPAKRIFGNTHKREQLQAAFATPEHYQDFAKAMREEIAAADTKQKVLGGSRTDINLSDDGKFLGAAMQVSKKGLIPAVREAAGKAIYNKYVGVNKSNAMELAGILTDKTKGLDALSRLIAKQKEPEQLNLLHGAIMDNLPKYLSIGIDQAIK